MRGHGRAGYARGSRAGPQHVPQDALDKKKPSFRLEGDSSPRQALRLPVIRSSDRLALFDSALKPFKDGVPRSARLHRLRRLRRLRSAPLGSTRLPRLR